MGDAGERATDDGKRSLLSPGDGADLLEDRDQDLKDQDQGDQDQTGPPRTPVFVLVLTGFSALGGFLLGYDTGVVSGAMLPLRRELHLDSAWQTWLVCSAVGAAAVAALLGGAPHAKLGRRGSALLAGAAVTAGGLVMGAAPDKETLLAGRVLVGLGIGLSSMTVPVYIAEVSPPHLRGMLVTLNNVFITGGQLAASLVDGAFSAAPRDGWRYMLGLSVAPALLQFVGFLFLPESPRWLLQKGRSQESRAVLQRIRGGKGVEEELDSIKTSMEEEAKEADGGGLVICRMLGHAPTRRALTVGCGMQMFQQLCGINTVMYFSATILQMAGVRDDKEAIWLTSATAGTNFLFTLVGVWLVERVGRRRLSLWSMLGTALSLCVLAVGFLLAAQNSPPVSLHPLHQPNSTCTQYGSCEGCMLDPACGFCYRENATTVFDSSCLPTADTSTDRAAWGSCSNQTAGGAGSFWAYNYCPTSYSWVVLLGLILYLAAFAPGMGPMPWTVNSEIYPLWARSTGNACSAGVNWVCNVLVSLTFLQMAQLLTYHGAFFLYAAVSALGVLFILACLPETQGLQLEEMEGLFAGRLCSFGAPTASDAIRYSRVTSSDPRRPLDAAERSDSD